MANSREVDLEKTSTLQIEDFSSSEKDAKAGVQGGDYSGAAEKTDPKEIALVKKLDYRIMPTLFAMYFLYDLSHDSFSNSGG